MTPKQRQEHVEVLRDVLGDHPLPSRQREAIAAAITALLALDGAGEWVPYQVARTLLGDAYNAGTHGIGYSQQVMELQDATIDTTPSTSDEWVLVPRVPTEEMLEQFKRPPFAGLTLGDRYARMLAAATPAGGEG